MVVVVGVLIWTEGCQPSRDIVPCGQLPDVTGCPTSRGGTCSDPECAALYECVDGTWDKVASCDQDTTTSVGGGGQGGHGTGGCSEVVIDISGQAVGCQPDLQEPDCPVAAAQACQPCLTGCVDFFFCASDGWLSVAYCDRNGALVVE